MSGWTWLGRGTATALLVVLLLPIAALVFYGAPSEVARALLASETWLALRVSVVTSSIALLALVLGGMPLAWWIATRETRASRVVEVCVRLPLIIPPAVAGLALLLVVGREGWMGASLSSVGVTVAFQGTAVVLAQVFVAAPFFVQGAVAAFRALPRDSVEAARTLGMDDGQLLVRVAWVAERRALLAAATLAWARALGEFGATLMVAGNVPGVTRTLPLAVYTALDRSLEEARAASWVLLGVALVAMVVAERWGRR